MANLDKYFVAQKQEEPTSPKQGLGQYFVGASTTQQPIQSQPQSFSEPIKITGSETFGSALSKGFQNVPRNIAGLGKGLVEFGKEVVKAPVTVGTQIGERIFEGKKTGLEKGIEALQNKEQVLQTLDTFAKQSGYQDWIDAVDEIRQGKADQRTANMFLAPLEKLAGFALERPVETALAVTGAAELADKSQLVRTKGGIIRETPTGETVSLIKKPNSLYPVTKIAEGIEKGTEKVASKIGKGLGKTSETVTSQVTGLSPKTIETLKQAPDEFSEANKVKYSRENIGEEVFSTIKKAQSELRETGSAYNPIREARTPVVGTRSAVIDFLNANGLQYDNFKNKIKLTADSTLDSKDVKVIQEFLDRFAKDSIDSNQYLNARMWLDDKARWNVDTSRSGQNFIKRLRGVVGEVGDKQIPGLSELDDVYKSESKFLSNVAKDYLKKDGNNYVLKDEALSKIANLTNEGRQNVLARLQRYIPDIDKKVNITQALEDIEKTKGQKTGTYVRSLVGAGGGFATGGLPGAIAGIVATSPDVASTLIRAGSKLGSKTAPFRDKVNQLMKQINRLELPPAQKQKINSLFTEDLIGKKAKLGLSLEDVSGQSPKGSMFDDLENEARKYKTAEEFVKAQEAPKTVTVWNKSKFSNEGAYTERPVIRKVENKTLYQGGDDSRQFWTPNKKYAEQFGNVKEKTGTFYQIDNGNRMTDVYVDASKTKSQLTDIWEKANKPLLKKYAK